jgi:hypothetical protein
LVGKKEEKENVHGKKLTVLGCHDVEEFYVGCISLRECFLGEVTSAIFWFCGFVD